MGADVEFEIKDSEAYRHAMNALNRRSQPPAVLRMIMNAFESYRASRKIGWSRPWNKYGIRTFQSYKLDMQRDGDLVAAAGQLLALPAIALDDTSQGFVDGLLDASPAAREQLMGFLFFHEAEVDGGLREGVVLSLGRVNTKRRHRDRLDLVLEADVEGDAVSPLNHLTVYVDPYLGKGPPLFDASVPVEDDGVALEVFQRLTDCYQSWGREDARLWDHWTSQYIDYFAPRRRAAGQTHFPETPHEAAWRETLSGK